MPNHPFSIMVATGPAASGDFDIGLERGHAVLVQANDPAELFACAADCPPDVVVFDHSMPHAMTLVDGLRIHAPSTAMVYLGSADEELTFSMITRGAHAAVRSEGELPSAVEAVARGESVITPGAAARILDELTVRSRRQHDLAAHVPSLTHVEAEILARRADGWTSSDIARRYEVVPRLVDVHVAQAVAKLHRHTVTEQIDTVEVANESD